jgi:ElaB/YqjD/DUF883 family membrane-anchored ribosome-binding protein
MSIADDEFAVNHNFDLFLEEKTTMTDDTTTNVSDKANGSDVTDSDLITTARSIGASAGAAAAKASDLAHTAQDYGHKLSEAATQAKDLVGEKVVVVKDKIKELSDVDFGELAENAKSYARRNPGQAILISAAAGLLLGLIIRGRR